MNETQVGGLITGLVVMLFFGYGWSLETLRAKQGLCTLIKTGNRHSIVIVLYLFGFLIGTALLVLTTIPLGNALLTKDTDNKKKVAPSYVLFLDTSVIINEGGKIDLKTLNLLNVFLERTKPKIVIISGNRFNRNTFINHNLDILKLVCANYGIKGDIIGSIPYTKGAYTKHQEIKLWVRSTKTKYDNCVIIDKGTYSSNNIKYTVYVDKLLTSRHLLAVIKVLETVYDPNIFAMRTQNYDDFFKSREQVSERAPQSGIPRKYVN